MIKKATASAAVIIHANVEKSANSAETKLVSISLMDLSTQFQKISPGTDKPIIITSAMITDNMAELWDLNLLKKVSTNFSVRLSL